MVIQKYLIRMFVGLWSLAILAVCGNAHAYSTKRLFAYCEDRKSLEQLAEYPETDRSLEGLRVTVEVTGKEKLRYGAFVEGGKISSTERAAFSEEMSSARKAGEVYSLDVRTTLDFNLAASTSDSGKTFSSPDTKRQFTLTIRKGTTSSPIQVSDKNKLYGGNYVHVGILTTTVYSHPEGKASQARQVTHEELLCSVVK